MRELPPLNTNIYRNTYRFFQLLMQRCFTFLFCSGPCFWLLFRRGIWHSPFRKKRRLWLSNSWRDISFQVRGIVKCTIPERKHIGFYIAQAPYEPQSRNPRTWHPSLIQLHMLKLGRMAKACLVKPTLGLRRKMGPKVKPHRVSRLYKGLP